MSQEYRESFNGELHALLARSGAEFATRLLESASKNAELINIISLGAIVDQAIHAKLDASVAPFMVRNRIILATDESAMPYCSINLRRPL